jgi:hypothetical protein
LIAHDTPPPPDDAAPAADRREQLLTEAERAERERAACLRLARVHGTHELPAALLALLLPAGSKRALIAWRIDTEDAPNAQTLLDDVSCLTPAARLPWFERLLARMAGMPLAARKTLLENTRRLMSARNRVRPIDRLHWLVMRQRFGETAHYGARTGADADISLLQESAVMAIATYTGFLARMIPGAQGVATSANPNTSAKELAQQNASAWYASVMAPWVHRADIPPCTAPSVDGLVLALYSLRALPWLQRPVVVRGWVGAAVEHSRHGRLDDTAADALRLTCTLLDCPLPPTLVEHFTEAIPEGPLGP